MEDIKRNSFFGEFEEIAYTGNNTVMYNTMIKVKIYCNMSFELYPIGSVMLEVLYVLGRVFKSDWIRKPNYLNISW